MAYFSFLPDVRPTAAQFNNDVRTQSVITCQSFTRPGSGVAVAGMRIYETDTGNEYIRVGSSWVLYNQASAGAPWVSFTPSWRTEAGLVGIGNGSILGKYRRVGQTVDVKVSVVFGSTTIFTGTGWSFSFPSGTPTSLIPNFVLLSSGATTFLGIPMLTGNYNVEVRAPTSTTNARLVPLSATSPGTWAAGNWIYLSYRALAVGL